MDGFFELSFLEFVFFFEYFFQILEYFFKKDMEFVVLFFIYFGCLLQNKIRNELFEKKEKTKKKKEKNCLF